MGGIHPERACAILGVRSEEYESLCAVAVRRRAAPDTLPDDLRAREVPSTRKAIGEFAVRAPFKSGGRFAGGHRDDGAHGQGSPSAK
jgi:hypothetical protein